LAGLALVLVQVGGVWEVAAALVLALGVLNALRGVFRKAWLHLGGSDQPVRTYLRSRGGR
jgi:hypothetical protein